MVASCDTDNQPSIGTLERIGFHRADGRIPVALWWPARAALTLPTAVSRRRHGYHRLRQCTAMTPERSAYDGRMQAGEWFGVRCWFLFESGALERDRAQPFEARVNDLACCQPHTRKQAADEGDAYAGEVGATRIDYIGLPGWLIRRVKERRDWVR